MWGVAGAVLLFLSLATAMSLAVPPLWPNDETSHQGYAMMVWDGDLPTVDTPIPTNRDPVLDRRLRRDADWGMEYRQDVLAAVHPPLYYAIAGSFLQRGETLGDPVAGLYWARFASVVIGAAMVPAVAWLSRLLLPGRRFEMVLSCGLVIAPSYVFFSATLRNDPMFVVLASVALGLLAIVLTTGTRGRELALLSGSLAAACLTRTSGLLLAAVCVGALVLADLRGPDRRSQGRSVFRSLERAAVVSIGPVALASWFYIRNLVLYGDVTGTSYLLDKVGRSPRPGTMFEVLVHPQYYLHLTYQHLGRVASGEVFTTASLSMARVLLALLCIMSVVPVIRALRRMDRTGRDVEWIGRTWRAWGPGIVFGALLLVAGATFFSHGGSPSARYMLPIMGVAAVGLSAAVRSSLPRPWGRLLVSGVAVGLILALNVLMLRQFVLEENDVYLAEGLDGLLREAGLSIDPVAFAVLVLGTGVVGLLLFATSVARTALLER